MSDYKCLLATLIFTLCCLMFGLMAGSSWISFDELYTGLNDILLTNGEAELIQGQLLWWRLPRVFGGFFCGAMLAVAGSLYQRVFQNPLVAPDILGTSAGAALGTMVAVSLGSTLGLVNFGAIVGGVGAAILALLVSFILGRRGGMNVLVLILCGILLSSFLASVLGAWRYLTPDNGALRGMFYLMSGGLGAIGWDEFILLAIISLVCVVPVLFLKPFLRLLALPMDVLVTQGINVRLWSLVVLLVGAVLAATTVATAGVIGWVALVVPNIVGYCTKSSGPLLSVTALLGGCFLVIADMIGRSFTTAEIPVGIITGIVGIPFFLLILYVEMRRISH